MTPESDQLLREALVSPLRGARQVTLPGGALDVSVGTGDTVISHPLRSVPRGYLITSLSADARVWQSAPATASTLTLRASAACTVRLAVF